jgi:hypothetical protein
VVIVVVRGRRSEMGLVDVVVGRVTESRTRGVPGGTSARFTSKLPPSIPETERRAERSLSPAESIIPRTSQTFSLTISIPLNLSLGPPPPFFHLPSRPQSPPNRHLSRPHNVRRDSSPLVATQLHVHQLEDPRQDTLSRRIRRKLDIDGSRRKHREEDIEGPAIIGCDHAAERA